MSASEELAWSVDPHSSEKSIEELRRALAAFNLATASIDQSRELGAFIHAAQGRLVGGVLGLLWGQCLETRYLWVEGRLRGQGYGTKLVTTLEEEARAKGCQLAFVDIFNLQAPAFYAKLGYEIFGSVEGYPHGYQKFFLT